MVCSSGAFDDRSHVALQRAQPQGKRFPDIYNDADAA
jgi:hypothetical protein